MGLPRAPAPDPPDRCEVAVVGGGILGLALARELLMRRPGATVCVLEREQEVAAHQSGHNSGVIHAGIYYEHGSLKARLCVDGARRMFSYCEENHIPHRRCGKLIVATGDSELARLHELERRASANGVRGIKLIGPQELREIEPHARGIAALHSPDSGVVDYGEVARSLANDVVSKGGSVITGCDVHDLRDLRRSVDVGHACGVTQASRVVCCAGAWADRLAVTTGAGADPRIVPFRGAYLRLVPERRELVRSLIYPVPDPSLPFLGVHLTRTMDDEVLLGPTALISPTRAHRAGARSARDLLETLTWPGTWRMFRQWWPSGVREVRHAAVRSSFVRSAARYVPELRSSDLTAGFVGVRAQALARNGRLVDDFVFSRTARVVHVRSAPSPAATASLAIARHLADVTEHWAGENVR